MPNDWWNAIDSLLFGEVMTLIFVQDTDLEYVIKYSYSDFA